MKAPERPTEKSILAVDTGGTFTDFYLWTPQGVLTHKVLSTPGDPSLAIRQGLKKFGLRTKIEIVHGSTVATNALLEGKGARVVLLTTAGFEDLLEIGRQNRRELYALHPQKTPPLVAAPFRFGVVERLSADGKVLTSLDRPSLRKTVAKLRKRRFDSLAVCLLFSYANSRHERSVAQFLARLNKPVSIASAICPEFREYERCSTTCVNAYVAPLMARYLGHLRKHVQHPIRVMQSNGGSLSIAEASQEAVRTLLSGPAGGALGALQIARRAGCERALTFDMGGTSTDMSLIDGGLELTSDAILAGHPVKTPMLRIDTIGAGGGSLAWTDAGGALRVGPRSAGADPGPICYGRGGKQITVTDAHVWLGRIPAQHFLGGTMRIFPKKIRKPLLALARRLKLSPEATAEGILKVANANMARSLRVLSLERGYDPRRFTLLPFGGAGPLHAAELAEELGIPRVLVPANPGLLSTYGMAFADWLRDYVQTVLLPEATVTASLLKHRFSVLEKQAKHEARREGISVSSLRLQASLDLRYQGQSYELTVPMTTRYRKTFAEAHRQRYGYLHRGRPIEVVNLRLQARAALHSPPRAAQGPAVNTKPKPQAETQLYWRGKFHPCPVFLRHELPGSWMQRGPVLVAEYSANTVVPPHWKIQTDRFGNLILEADNKRKSKHG